MGAILALLLILWITMQTAWFQNYLSKQLSKRFSNELQTTVEISSLRVSYFDHLILKDVLVLDQQDDTMFYIEALDVNYDLWSFNSARIPLDEATLTSADVRVGIHEGEESLNLQFIIDYFKPDTTQTPKPAPIIAISQLDLENCRFNFFNRNYDAPLSRSFNENDMVFSSISGTLDGFEIINDSLRFQVEGLSSTEKCGLEISSLSSDVTISSTVMEFDALRLQTPKSDVKDYLKFSYTSYRDLAEFIDLVFIDARLYEARIHSDDLAYFSNNLSPYNDLMIADGNITGTVSNIRGKELEITAGSQTSFEGDIRIKGIPDTENSYWDIDAEKFSTEAHELGKYLQLDEVPEEMEKLGIMSFSGKFQGFLKEFVCYGNLETDLGPAETDIKFEVNPEGREIYSGFLKSPGINLAPLLDYNNIGYAGFDLNIEGKGLEIEKLDADIQGTIDYISFNNYSYRNIEIDGNIKEDVYTGFASISDPNLTLNFEGTIDATVDHPTINVTAHAQKINLKTLGLDTEDSYLQFDGEVNMENFEDDIYGVINLDSITLRRSGNVLPLKQVDIVASKSNENSEKQILLHSEILNLQLTGDYTVFGLPELAENIIAYILPHDEQELKREFDQADIHLKASVPSFHPILKEYLPHESFESAYLEVDFNSEQDVMHSAGWIMKPGYEGFMADSLHFAFDRSSKLEPMLSKVWLGKVFQRDTFLLKEITFEGKSLNNRLDFDLKALRDSTLSAEFDAYLITKEDSVEVYINEVSALINNKLWYMEQTQFANIVYHENLLELLYIDLRNGEEIMFIDATLGKEMQRISLVLDNFLLENINPFVSGTGLVLGGVSGGFIDIKYYKDYPIFESNLEIKDLAYDGERLGNFKLETNSGDNPLQIIVDGTLVDGLVTSLDITGNVDFNTPEDALDVHLITKNSPISLFEPYLEGLASDIEGLLSADIKVGGPIDAPQLSGDGDLDDLKFKVDYLQTVYTSEAKIEIGSDYFKFKEASITDRFGSLGKVAGYIRHDNYTDFNFDIDILNLKNFECMNTSKEDNELFYGSAFADGNMKIAGPLEDILLQIEAKSRKGTKIFIPLDDIETEGQVSYIKFVDFNQDNNDLKDAVKTADGVRMDFNFEITNDAEIELIFDELLGDVIKGQCHGNLRMEINTYGDFNMYGGLTIDKGSYLFTAFNFINKYFTVAPGGTLLWDGDPYNATIDMIAEKREYPVPYTLLAGMVSEEDAELYYKDPIPVDCQIHLTGLLFNPNISFGLDFPSSNSLANSGTSTFNTVIERIRQDQEELDRQVFALIVLGSFIPPSFASSNGVFTDGTGIQSSVNNNLSEFVSSQLSNWLSQIDRPIQLGVDYQGATDLSRAELILSIKQQFWGDKFEYQISYDVASAGGNNLYDVNVQYSLTDDGSFKLRGFRRDANDPTLGNIANVTTTGLGLFYRHQFDYFWFNKPDPIDSTQSDTSNLLIIPADTSALDTVR